MSSVVDAVECRIWPCASFPAAAGIFNQTVREVRRLRQFAQPRPSFLAAGLMKRVRVLSSRIWLAVLYRLENQVVRSVGLHNLIFTHGSPGLHLDGQYLHTVNLLDNTSV